MITPDAIVAMAELHRSMATVHRLDIWHLVSVGYREGEISIGKASELLGIPLAECQRILPAPTEVPAAALRAVLAAARAILPKVGELDDNGTFTALPHPSLSATEREEIAPWIEPEWMALGCAIDGCEP